MTRKKEKVLWGTSMFALSLVWLQVAAPRKVVEVSGSIVKLAAPDSSPQRDLTTAAEAVIARDLFRRERRPADVRYGFESPPEMEATSSADVPDVRLAGTVGGPPWQAVIDGVPGIDGGVLVSSGDTLGDLRILRISQDSLTLQQGDTMWTITIGSRWHD